MQYTCDTFRENRLYHYARTVQNSDASEDTDVSCAPSQNQTHDTHLFHKCCWTIEATTVRWVGSFTKHLPQDLSNREFVLLFVKKLAIGPDVNL